MVYESLLPALDNYARILNQSGFNHAIGEYNSAREPKPAKPEKPTISAPDRSSSVDIGALITNKGSGQGLADNGGLTEAAVGASCPDGNTEDLRDAEDSWQKLGLRKPQAVADLETLIVDFQHLDAKDAEGIVEDLQDLEDAVTDVFSECSKLASFAGAQRGHLEKLRSDTLPKAILDEVDKMMIGSNSLRVLRYSRCDSLGSAFLNCSSRRFVCEWWKKWASGVSSETRPTALSSPAIFSTSEH